MPRYGINLQQILNEKNSNISTTSIYYLGLKLLDILEVVHNSGLVHNDIKPDNILIGYGESIQRNSSKSGTSNNMFGDVNFHLVDFGLATKWRDVQTGMHLK